MALWSVLVVIGLGVMMNYHLAPGELVIADHTLPEVDPLTSHQGDWTLIMFAHPRCPCTRASLDELAEIVALAEQPMTVYVVFYRPDFPSEKEEGWDWAHGDLWKQAAQIPSVTVVDDPGGRLAERFQARCSGVVVVYDPGRQLRYQGGITGSRGHVGDNVGRQSVIQILKQSDVTDPLQVLTTTDDPVTCSVYGCPIFARPASQ